MRPPIIVKNTDKSGRVMDDKWYVRIGKKWRLFGQKEWEDGGLAWINEQLTKGA